MSFKWIAAGTSYDNFGGYDIYVRLAKRKGPYTEIFNPNGTEVHLKDRVIFLTKPGIREYNIYTPIYGYDYCINADIILKDSAVKHTGLMLAYEDSNNKCRYAYDKSKFDFMFFADSGGFQIYSGVRQFVDPVDLARFNNKYATHGMILDIPTRMFPDWDIVKKTALIQKKNNKIILKHIDKSVQLYNVVHGATIKMKRDFIDIVSNDKINNWAIGGTTAGNIFDLIHQVFGVTTYIKGADKYHILGVANTLTIIILAWIGKYINLTSDSSSHLQSGICSVIFTIMEHKFKKLSVGGKRGFQLQSFNEPAYLPCTSTILSAVDTTEIFNHSKASKVCHYLAILHNINVMSQYAKIWNDLAQNLSVKEYKKVMKKTIPDKYYHVYSSAIDFIEHIVNDGFDKADKRFKSYISLINVNKEDLGIKLFSKEEKVEKFSVEDRLKKIINNFERYHNGEKVDTSTGKRFKHIKIRNKQVFG